MIDLSGQKYLITGSTSGIGLGVSKLLNELGASVTLCGRNESKLKEARGCLLYPDKSEVLQIDLLEEFSIKPFLIHQSTFQETHLKHCNMCRQACPGCSYKLLPPHEIREVRGF